MGLKITRTRSDGDDRPAPTPSVSSNTSSIWSARDLCPVEMLGVDKPTFVEHVSPDENGHLGKEQISQLFDRLWALAANRSHVIAHLDMAQVKSSDAAFHSELEFYRRELQRRGGDVRVTAEAGDSK